QRTFRVRGPGRRTASCDMIRTSSSEDVSKHPASLSASPPMSRQFILACCLLFPSCLSAADWPGFRGPTGQGTSEEKGLPEKWSSTENIVWKVDLPGPGASSPIVVGEKVFVTAYSGY